MIRGNPESLFYFGVHGNTEMFRCATACLKTGHFSPPVHIVYRMQERAGAEADWRRNPMKGNVGAQTGRGMKISDFQTKEVINITDGKRLGQISDLELDLRQGRIEAIVVPGYTRFMGLFGGGTDLIIPWRNIVKIGSDVILVKMDEVKEPTYDEGEREARMYDAQISRAERMDRTERLERSQRRSI